MGCMMSANHASNMLPAVARSATTASADGTGKPEPVMTNVPSRASQAKSPSQEAFPLASKSHAMAPNDANTTEIPSPNPATFVGNGATSGAEVTTGVDASSRVSSKPMAIPTLVIAHAGSHTDLSSSSPMMSFAAPASLRTTTDDASVLQPNEPATATLGGGMENFSGSGEEQDGKDGLVQLRLQLRLRTRQLLVTFLEAVGWIRGLDWSVSSE